MNAYRCVIKKLFFVFAALVFGTIHTFGQRSLSAANTQKATKLFVKEGLRYGWNFEFAEKTLTNIVGNTFNEEEKKGDDGKLRKEGNVEFINGVAKFYDNPASLKTNISYDFKGNATLWTRFLLPEIRNNAGDKFAKQTFLELDPFQLYFVTSKEKENKYAIGGTLAREGAAWELEPSPQYLFTEGAWVQVALVISGDAKNSQAKLFCREEKLSQTANNWTYIGRMVLPTPINLSKEMSFGVLKSDPEVCSNLKIDEIRIYDVPFGIDRLGDLWPVYHNFNPDKETPPGVVIDYCPAMTKKFVAGSPSIVKLNKDTYIAKCDDYGPAVGVSELTRVYQSTDKGTTWKPISEIEGLSWASIFLLRGNLYMMGTSAGHEKGHVVIIQSTDEGYTWTKPTDEQNGLLIPDLSYHTAPVPVVIHNGRIWRTMEDEKGPGKWGMNFRAFLMSASLNDDLLKASSWVRSNTLGYNPAYMNGNFKGWLEGNTILKTDGTIVNVLRVSTAMGGSKAAIITYNREGTQGTFDEQNGFVDFPGGSTKFHILYDEKSGVYWALSNAVPEKHRGKAYSEGLIRNTLVLMTSKDLVKWDIRKELLYHPDIMKHAFQYPTFIFDGDDIVYVSRTAYDDGKGGAYRQHDANFFTFHRIDNFRSLLNSQLDKF